MKKKIVAKKKAKTKEPAKQEAQRQESPPPEPPKPEVAPASDRHAHGVDADIKAENLRRLARIQGQVGGLARMVEAERY